MTKIPALIKYFFGFFLLTMTVSVSALAGDDAFENTCPTLTDLINEGETKCLLCNLYEIVMEACSKVITGSWNAFAKPLQGVVCIGTAIYIAVYTLKNIASFSQQDSMAYLSNDKTGIVPLCVKAGIVIWLLNNQSFLYSHILGPVIQTGVNIGNEIADGGLSTGLTSTNDVNTLFKAIIDEVRTFYSSIYQIVALGRLLLCLPFLPDNIIDWHFSLIPFGAILYIFGWFILIGVSFYLLDVLFRLAVGCILLPMAIACGVSKFTVKYTRETWNLFVNVFFSFIVLGIILTLTTKMIEVAVSGLNDVILLMTAKNFVNNEEIKALIDKFADEISLKAFILTVICCMVCFKLFISIESLTEKLSSTSSVGKLGQKLAGEAAQPLVNKGKQLYKATKILGKAAAKETASSFADTGLGRGIRRAKKRVKGLFGLS